MSTPPPPVDPSRIYVLLQARTIYENFYKPDCATIATKHHPQALISSFDLFAVQEAMRIEKANITHKGWTNNESQTTAVTMSRAVDAGCEIVLAPKVVRMDEVRMKIRLWIQEVPVVKWRAE